MDRKKFKILLVDDEKSILLLLRRIVEDEGYAVRTAANGQEALSIGETWPPHIIITDLKMPVMDGMALFKHHKRMESEVDFIVLTAYGAVETAIQAMKMGALD